MKGTTMDDKIIKKIELDIDGVGINLTPEQAKKLHAALAELLGVEKETRYVPSPYPVPYVPPYRPYRWYDGTTWTIPAGTVTSPNITGVRIGYNTSTNVLKMSV